MAGMFTTDELKKHIERAVSDESLVPAGKTAVLVTVANLDQVQIAMAIKVPHGWTVDILGSYEWSGEKHAEVTVTKSW